MRSDWGRITIVFFLLLTVAWGSSVTIGFNLILQSRMGITMGYFYNDHIGIEAHFGGIKKKMIRYGLSCIFIPASDDKNMYFLVGYAAGIRWNVFHERKPRSFYPAYYGNSPETYDKGFNIAVGYDVNLTDANVHVPLEGGIYLVTYSKLIQYNDPVKGPVVVEGERIRRKPFIVPLVGFGVRYHLSGNN